MMVVVAVIGIFIAIALFFSLSNLNKVVFLGYACFFLHECIYQNYNDGIYLLKLLAGGVALFIFLVSISLAETKQGKKDVALFFLKYGGLYFIMVTLLKLALFASTGFDLSSWEGIDMVVTFLPYKWVLFILFLAGINAIKNNSKRLVRKNSMERGKSLTITDRN